MSYLDEALVEIVTVEYFRELGYDHIHAPVIAPDGEAPERVDYAQVVLARRLRDAMASSIRTCRTRPSRTPCRK